MNTTNQHTVVSLSQEEIFVILTYLQTDSLVGLDGSVLQELSEREVRIILGVAERALIAREFLIPAENGNRGLQLMPAIQALLGTCIKPEKTLIVSYDRPTRLRESLYFHQRGNLLVSHTIPLSAIHQFAALDRQLVIPELLLALLDLESLDDPVATGASTHVSQAVITQARDAAQQGASTAIALMTGNGLPAEFANAFAATLTDMKLNMTLVFLDNYQDSAANAEGFTLLIGPNGCWRLEPDETGTHKEPWLVITPLEPQDVSQAIQNVVGLFR